MKKAQLLLLLILIFNLSCSNNDSEVTESIWVDSERVNCIGVDEQTCYRIQENASIDETKWELFYDGIEGFDEQYEAGYIYRLSVTKVNVDNPPADASSVKYFLNKVISKALDE